MNRKPTQSKMILSPRETFRFVAVLMICSIILVPISATDDTLEGLRRREDDQNSHLLSANGAEAAGKPSLLYREPRAVKNNASPNLSDIEKRLQAMEGKYVLLNCQFLICSFSFLGY